MELWFYVASETGWKNWQVNDETSIPDLKLTAFFFSFLKKSRGFWFVFIKNATRADQFMNIC